MCLFTFLVTETCFGLSLVYDQITGKELEKYFNKVYFWVLNDNRNLKFSIQKTEISGQTFFSLKDFLFDGNHLIKIWTRLLLHHLPKQIPPYWEPK